MSTNLPKVISSQLPAIREELLPAVRAAQIDGVLKPAESVRVNAQSEPISRFGEGIVGSMARLGVKELGNAFTHGSPIVDSDPGQWFNATPQEVFDARQTDQPDALAGVRLSLKERLDQRLSAINDACRGVHGMFDKDKERAHERGPELE